MQGNSNEQVYSPSHYIDESRSIETINVIEKIIDGLPAQEAYFLGNILKYALRAGKKDNAEADLAKANNYAFRLVTGRWRDER